MKITPVNVADIPAELTALPQFVTWKYNQHKSKLPCSVVTGRVADAHDPANWGTIDQAIAAYQRFGHAGIGFDFTADDPYTGIDLDNSIGGDGRLKPGAAAIVAEMDTYTEISPSEKGVKMWVRGTIPAAITPTDIGDGVRIEMYSRARFFTVTGNKYPGTPDTIRATDRELADLYARVKPAQPDEPDPMVRRIPVVTADADYARRYVLGALEGEHQKMLSAGDGKRHWQRWKSAKALGGFVPVLSEQEIFDSLAVNFGQDRRSAELTITDGIAAGKEEPRLIPEPKPKDPKHGLKIGTSSAQIESPDMLAQLSDFPNTDAGNAECLELLYRDELRYCHDRKKWLAWDGNRWVIDGDGAAERHALAVVRARRVVAAQIEDNDKARKAFSWALGSESEGKRNAMLSTARILQSFATRVDLYDRDPLLAGVPNGVLDLEHGQHRESRREDYITAQLGADYKPDAMCPRWLQFLDEVFAGDAELIAYIQRAIGYSLTGDTREHKLFLCFGHGANGKSVFLDVLSRLLGEYAANTSFDTFDAGRRNEATNDLAALKGKRLVTVIETEDDRRLAEARVKQVTGQDKVTCRFLYGEYFDYRPQFKIWMAMNHKPVINGTDNGIWRRIQLIPFTQSFLDREDKTLGAKLHAEMSGILNWALAGLTAWLRDGLGTAKAIEDATREYRRESDLVSQWLDECTTRDVDGRMPAGDAIDSYTAWCKRNGYRAPTSRSLGRRLAEIGSDLNIDVMRSNGLRYYTGLRLSEGDSAVSAVSKPFSGNSSLETTHEDFLQNNDTNDTNDTIQQTPPQKTQPKTADANYVRDLLLRRTAADTRTARDFMAGNAGNDWSKQIAEAEAIAAHCKAMVTS